MYMKTLLATFCYYRCPRPFEDNFEHDFPLNMHINRRFEKVTGLNRIYRIIDTVNWLVQIPNVKFCVSSRAENFIATKLRSADPAAAPPYRTRHKGIYNQRVVKIPKRRVSGTSLCSEIRYSGPCKGSRCLPLHGPCTSEFKSRNSRSEHGERSITSTS
jgi:hypothetical protein